MSVTDVSATEVKGSYDLVLDGEVRKGSFLAPLCVKQSPPPTPTMQCLPSSTP